MVKGIVVTTGIKQVLRCQCTCVSFVRSDLWARFIPVEKLTPAPAFKRWVCSRAVDESDSPIATVAGPPTAREQYKVLRRCGWTCYSGDQSVGAPARWAGVDFSRVSNLHLRTSFWYSSNWNCKGGCKAKTLPKAQRTRGLSSFHKFKHKSWSNFIFRISTRHQLQNLNQTSVFPKT